MKKTLFVLIMVVALALIAAAPAASTLAQLTIINNLASSEPNGGVILFQLTWNHDSDPTRDLHFYFQVQSGDEKVFTVPRHDDYAFTLWACGASSSGSLDVSTNLTLSFPNCTKAPDKARAGEPSMEKVIIKQGDEIPPSPGVYYAGDWYNQTAWRLQWDGLYDGAGMCIDPWGEFVENTTYTDVATGETVVVTCDKSVRINDPGVNFPSKGPFVNGTPVTWILFEQ